MIQKLELMSRCRGWGGARSYDIGKRGFEHAFPIKGMPKSWSWSMSMHIPSEVWITPNM
jgi:hypothetical protein